MSVPDYLLEPDFLVDASYCPDHGEYDGDEGACPVCAVETAEQYQEWAYEKEVLA